MTRRAPEPPTYKVRCPDCGELCSSPLVTRGGNVPEQSAGWDAVLLARHHRNAPDCPWHQHHGAMPAKGGGEQVPSALSQSATATTPPEGGAVTTDQGVLF